MPAGRVIGHQQIVAALLGGDLLMAVPPAAHRVEAATHHDPASDAGIPAPSPGHPAARGVVQPLLAGSAHAFDPVVPPALSAVPLVPEHFAPLRTSSERNAPIWPPGRRRALLQVIRI